MVLQAKKENNKKKVKKMNSNFTAYRSEKDGSSFIGLIDGEETTIQLDGDSEAIRGAIEVLDNLPVSTYWRDVQDPRYKCSNPGTISDNMLEELHYEDAMRICEKHHIDI